MNEVYFAKQDSSFSAEELEKLQVLCIRVGNKLIKKDYVKFNDFFNVLVQLCGDNIRPYIKQTYGAIRTAANDELYNKMDGDDIVRPFDINKPITEEIKKKKTKMIRLTYREEEWEMKYITVHPWILIPWEEFMKNKSQYLKLDADILEMIEQQANNHPTYQEAIMKEKDENLRTYLETEVAVIEGRNLQVRTLPEEEDVEELDEEEVREEAMRAETLLETIEEILRQREKPLPD